MSATTIRTRCHSTHYCDGCEGILRPGTEHLEHYEDGSAAFLVECLRCAARNGRPGVAEPDVAEQPLDLDGIA